MSSTATDRLCVFSPRKRRQCMYESKDLEEKIEQVGENNYPSPKELKKRKITSTSRRSMLSSLLEKLKSAGVRQKDCMEILNFMKGLDDWHLIHAKEYLRNDHQCLLFSTVRAHARLTWLKSRLTPRPCQPPNPYGRHFMGQNSNPYGAHMAEQTQHYGGYNGQPLYYGGSWEPRPGGGGNYMWVDHNVFPNANGQQGVSNKVAMAMHSLGITMGVVNKGQDLTNALMMCTRSWSSSKHS